METDKQRTVAETADPITSMGASLKNRAAPPAAASCRVMIVEDAGPSIPLLDAMLRMAGASDVSTVVDAQIALDCFRQFQPELVVVDLDLRHDYGLTVLTAIHHVAEERFLPLVAMTSDRTAHTRMAALAAGATELFTKPMDEIEFIERVRNLLVMRELYLEVQRQNRAAHTGIQSTQ